MGFSHPTFLFNEHFTLYLKYQIAGIAKIVKIPNICLTYF